MRNLLSLLGFIPLAHAQLSGIATSVSNGLLAGFGSGGAGASAYVGITEFILGRAWLIVGAFALLLLVRAGIKLIYGQSEDKFEEAKRAIANGLMAVVLTFLTQRVVDAFIAVGGSSSTGAASAGAQIFTTEILGILNWVTTLVAVLAIAMIISSVFTAMLGVGSEEGVAKMRRSIFGAAAGSIVILVDGAFRATFGLLYNQAPSGPSAFPLIEYGLSIVEALLTFMALAAVCIVVYAGIMMILSLGNEEQYKKMRSLILRSLLGLFVILVSFVIVELVVLAFG